MVEAIFRSGLQEYDKYLILLEARPEDGLNESWNMLI
jgi:hypothetical protein